MAAFTPRRGISIAAAAKDLGAIATKKRRKARGRKREIQTFSKSQAR